MNCPKCGCKSNVVGGKLNHKNIYRRRRECHNCNEVFYSVEIVEEMKTTRRDAVKNNFRFYNTGKTCVKGHSSVRYTSNGKCVKCEREKDNAKKTSRKNKKLACPN